MINSALNYTGSKRQLLPQLLPLLPKDIRTFVDLFAGGLNVTLNVEAENYSANDINHHVIGMYEYFRNTPEDELFAQIEGVIAKYGLSKQNNDGYKRLRDDYNLSPSSLLLYVLVCHSFSHLIRFNQTGEFNVPFGKGRSYFNKNTASNLREMLPKLRKVQLSCGDFRDLDLSGLGSGDVVYMDPPYLISTTTYNDCENGFRGWSPEDDLALFRLCDELSRTGVKFTLSNVMHHKGMHNQHLIDWASGYNVHHLNKKYNIATAKDKTAETDEVLVTNYEI